MNSIVCDFINPDKLVLDERELSKRLGSPNPMQEKNICDCIRRLKDVCKPRYCCAKTSVLLNESECAFDFMTVHSVSLSRALKGCKSAYVVAFTLGIEADRLIHKLGITSGADAFIADAVSSALAEAGMGYVCESLEGSLAERFSVGYGDFVLSNQAKILDYLSADKLLGIKLSESCIMTPRKSVTAIIGVID